MIIKIFKISTQQMCTIRGKKGLMAYIADQRNTYLPSKMTIDEMIAYLPVEEYYRVK